MSFEGLQKLVEENQAKPGSTWDYWQVLQGMMVGRHQSRVADRLERQVEMYTKAKCPEHYIPPKEDEEMGDVFFNPGVIVSCENLSDFMDKTPDPPDPPGPVDPPTPTQPIWELPEWLKWVLGILTCLALITAAAALWLALRPDPEYEGTVQFSREARLAVQAALAGEDGADPAPLEITP